MSIWSRFENWGHFVSGILMCVLGICLIFFNTYFVAGVTWWTGILLTLVGLFRAVEVFLPKHKAQGSKARLLNLVSALAHIILGTIVMTWSGDAAKLLSFGVGLYQLMIGLVSLFTYYLLQKDRAKGRLKELVIGLITFFWGIGSLLSTRSVRDTLVLVGIYVIFIGITWLIDARDLLMTDKTKQRKRRRWRVGVPVFFTMLIPADIHSKINHLLNDEVSPEEVEETLIPQVKKKVKGDPVLKVFIHVSEGIFGSVGHVDLSYKGRVYSYGSYDVDSERVFSAVGDGCFFTLDDKDYITYCLEYGKTLFEYRVALTKEQQEAFEKKLKELEDMTVPWELTSETQKASYMGLMVKRFHAETYKFTKSRFKTYFVLGTNCVLLADQLIGTSGLDLITMVGILSPGTYYEYFHKEYQKPNSIVVGETIHNASLNISEVEE